MPSLGLGLGINVSRGLGQRNPIPGLSPMMWLDASSLTDYEDEDPVDLWPDIGNIGNNAQQPSFSSRPIYSSSGINGKPALQFDGVDDYFSSVIALPQPLTVVMVIRLLSTTGVIALYDGANSRVQQYSENTPEGWRIFAGEYSSSGVLPTTSTSINAAVFNGTSSMTRINGVGTSALNVGGNALDLLHLGANFGTGNPVPGLIAEFIVFGAALSSEELIAVEAHLARKYSVSL